MNRRHLVAALALLGFFSGAASRVATAEEIPSGEAAEETSRQAKIERGSYLVAIMDCNACHTPWKMGENGPEPDMTRMLSGHPEEPQLPPAPELPAGPWSATFADSFTAWSGPWGTSFTRNLTPDADTGLGTWTEREFVDTIRNGRERGIGRELMPPMPWQAYRNATDEDLSALFAYLQSIPAISNRVPDNIAPAPAH